MRLVFALVGLLGTPLFLTASPRSWGADLDDSVTVGRALAHSYDKGNCLACHAAPTDPQAVTKANIAPPLVGMRERFPDREILRQQIWDASERNPDTIMPPFGRHRILTDAEIDRIIEYLYTL